MRYTHEEILSIGLSQWEMAPGWPIKSTHLYLGGPRARGGDSNRIGLRRKLALYSIKRDMLGLRPRWPGAK